MDRRTFLSRVILGGTAAISPAWRAATAATTFPGILLIDGVTPSTQAPGLFSFLDPIVSQNIPVAIVVKSDRETWEKSPSDADLMRLLSRLVADYPGLVDLALEVPALASLQPFLRMRSASIARNRFRQALVAATGDGARVAAPKTIVSQLPGDETPILDGLRSAGFLNSILLPQDGTPLDIWRNSDGTQQINGGWRLPSLPTGEDIAATLSKATSQEGPVVFAARFPDDLLQEADAFFDQGAVLGDGFRRNLISSRNYLILPSELRVRSGAVFSRHLVLCVDEGEAGAQSDALMASLTAAGVPFTAITTPSADAPQAPDAASAEAGANAPHRCVRISAPKGGKWQAARDLVFGDLAPGGDLRPPRSDTCAALGDGDAASAGQGEHAGFDIVFNTAKEGKRLSGFDEYGALRVNASLTLDGPYSGVSAKTLRARIEAAASPNEDVVLVIKQDGFRTPDGATALVEAIAALGKSDQFNVLSLEQYRAAVSVKSEPARLLRVAQRWPARQPAGDIPAAERDLLIEEARLAWSYVEQFTDPDTGLVPATAWIEQGKPQSYNFSTMWDTGSLILAILSAHSIGLLDDTGFSERINAVLGGLATGVFNGLRLPKGLAPTDGKDGGHDKYNASDTARLLVSLHLLETYSEKDLGIRGILDGWDLNQTIRDGVPLTARGKSLVSSYRSNYAAYIARAFGLWGFPVQSPYSDPQPGASFDQRVEILHDVAEFGPIGAEPHLLEAVELGASGLANAAAEALFAAQVEEYLSTGKLVCVSEGPINRDPWFVYQGFQIGEDEDKWTAETLDPSPRFETKGFIRAVEMLNSKAAFLWTVYRPGAYSDLLIAEVREKAKIASLGFSPGIFHVTGGPDQAYSDINTNGIILQAIAYRLNGSKPCAEWKSNSRN